MHPYMTELLIRCHQAELQKLAADFWRLPPRQRRWPTALARVRWHGLHRTAPHRTAPHRTDRADRPVETSSCST